MHILFDCAIDYLKSTISAYANSIRRTYLGEDKSDRKHLTLFDIFLAIQELGEYGYNDYVNDESLKNLYGSHSNHGSKKWEYNFLHMVNGRSIVEKFATEKETCVFIFDNATKTIETFKHAWIEKQKGKVKD